jgi:hypothetical protein
MVMAMEVMVANVVVLAAALVDLVALQTTVRIFCRWTT